MLILENSSKFILDNDLNQISIGRKDINSNPQIDLGPFDDGPYISRLQGVFYWEKNLLFYENKGKNPTLVNGKKILNQRIQLKNHDIIEFGKIKGEIILN